MVEQAQQIIVQAVATAATLPGGGGFNLPSQIQQDFGLSGYNNNSVSSMPPPAPVDVSNYGSVFSRSLLRLSPQDNNMETHQPAKISPPPSPLQSFASMKLVGMMKDGDTSKRGSPEALSLSRRKNRSVTWNQSVKAPSDAHEALSLKRRKISQVEQPKLLSSKSFGKPDASLFESKRNSTFAEFGQMDKNVYLSTYNNNRMKQPAGVNDRTPPAAASGRVGGLNQSVTFSCLRPSSITSPTGNSFGGGNMNANASFPMASGRPNPLLASFATSQRGLTVGGDLSDLRGFIGGLGQSAPAEPTRSPRTKEDTKPEAEKSSG